jgi:hypothetical protein
MELLDNNAASLSGARNRLAPLKSVYFVSNEGRASGQGTEPPMGIGNGDDPRSPAKRGWGWILGKSGIGGGDGPPIASVGVTTVTVCRAAVLTNEQQNELTPSFSGCHHPRKTLIQWVAE